MSRDDLDREERKPAPPPLTEAQAAARLGCSVKTLRSHIEAGELHYVQVGRGRERICRKFTVADIDAFVASQTRTEVPQTCPSAKTRVRRIGGSTSNIVAIGFSAQPKPPPGREAEAVERAERERAKATVAQLQAARTSLRLDDVAGRYWNEVGQHSTGLAISTGCSDICSTISVRTSS